MMEKRIASLVDGAILVVLATDPMARVDIPLFCTQHGHACAHEKLDGVLRFEIVKAGSGLPPSPPPPVQVPAP